MKKTQIALLLALALAATASAQSTWTGSTNTNNWNDASFWSNGIVPNAVNAVAVFTAVGNTRWTNTTNIIGTLLVSGGTATIGDPSVASQGLYLDTSSGKPIISNSSQIFMYADLQGTNGFTKLGSGDLSFRYNTRNLTYTGDINLLGGTLSVNQASSLGNANNQLLVGSNATFNVANGNNTGTYAFESTRTFVVSNGVTFNIRTSTNAIGAIFSNAITGAGRVDFEGVNSAAVSEATAHKYTLAGANTYSGRTTLQMGAKITLTNGSTLSTNELNISGGNGSWAGLDLGGATQNVSTFSAASSTTTARTAVISNGTLNVTAQAAAFAFNGTNGTKLDMSGLSGFSFDGATGNRAFTVQPNAVTNTNGLATLVQNTNSLYLAASGAGSNSISASSILVGGASGTAGNSNSYNQANLFIGKTNNFSATSLTVGGFNGAGVVEFGSGITNGALTLRGSNGVSRLGTLVIGATSSGLRSGAGTLNLSNGTINATVSNTYIGIFGANSTGPTTTSLLAMGGGSFDTINMTLAAITNTNINNASASIGATFQQNGGTVTVQKLTMGQSDTTVNVSGPVFLSTYNLSSSNAVLQAQTITAGASTNYSVATRRKINFGAGTIRNYDASTDLTIQGIDTTAQGRIEVAVASNSSAKVFYTDADRKITLEPSAVLTFVGSITKAGPGTLVLRGANIHTGNTAVSEGTLEITDTGSLAFNIGGNGTNNTLTGSGSAAIHGQFVLNLAGASTNEGDTWNIVSNSLTATYGTNFSVTGFNGSGGSWTNNTNGVNYVFSQSTGNLSVASSVTPPTGLSYTPSNVSGVVGTAITNLVASLSAGTADSYSIDPALPAGLSINPTSGLISGIPVAASVSTLYTVTATNTGSNQSTTAQVTIEILSQYAAWAIGYGLDPATSGALGADPDGDGFNNNNEYAYGTNPTVANGTLLTTSTTAGTLKVQWNGPTAGVGYVVQTTTNLGSTPFTVPTPAIDIDTTVQGIMSFTNQAAGNKFFRVQATITNN